MPVQSEQKDIWEMPVGATGYVYWWAIAADPVGNLVMQGSFPCETNSYGEPTMVKFERTAQGVNVYRSTLPVTARWKKGSPILATWHPLPVTLI